jgi:hypothetical protein
MVLYNFVFGVKITLFFSCFKTFHYFNVFYCFQKLCSQMQPHLDKYFSFGCHSLLHLGIVQYFNLKCVMSFQI